MLTVAVVVDHEVEAHGRGPNIQIVSDASNLRLAERRRATVGLATRTAAAAFSAPTFCVVSVEVDAKLTTIHDVPAILPPKTIVCPGVFVAIRI